MAKHSLKGLDKGSIAKLRAGDTASYTGTVYTARDAAHKKLVALIDAHEELPFPIEGSIIYYAGPAPAKPGKPIGSVGPTSSYRMEPYTPKILEAGAIGLIGKGKRSDEVVASLVANKAVYFAAVGGVAAYMARSVVSAELVAYEELGTEAIRKLEVVEMPLTVAVDCYGADIYREGPQRYLGN